MVGVIGTYNSGCAAIEIPILNEAPDGGVAMVSPGQHAGLPDRGQPQICDPEQPDSLLSLAATRNYARIVPNDAAQGAGLAAVRPGAGCDQPLRAVRRPTTRAAARRRETFVGAAQELGLAVAGSRRLGSRRPDYDALMDRVAEASPDAVVLAGLLEQNGAKLIQDKVAVLGDNDSVKLLAFDGFAQQATIDDAGEAAAGMFASVPGRTPDSLEGPGKELVSALESDLGADTPVELFAPYAGQAADLLLQTIESGASRSEIIEALFDAQIEDGILGSFEITKTGDPSVSPISVSRAKDEFELVEETTPEQAVIDAARGG